MVFSDTGSEFTENEFNTCNIDQTLLDLPEKERRHTTDVKANSANKVIMQENSKNSIAHNQKGHNSHKMVNSDIIK